MAEPRRIVGKEKIFILKPTIHEILDSEFNYGIYADEIVEDLIICHKFPEGTPGKYQRHLAGLENVDISVLFSGEKINKSDNIKKRDNAIGLLSKFYEEAIEALQYKFEYNRNLQNPDIMDHNWQITSAMQIITIDYIRKIEKVHRACRTGAKGLFDVKDLLSIAQSEYCENLLCTLAQSNNNDLTEQYKDVVVKKDSSPEINEKAFEPISSIIAGHREAAQEIVPIKPEPPLKLEKPTIPFNMTAIELYHTPSAQSEVTPGKSGKGR